MRRIVAKCGGVFGAPGTNSGAHPRDLWELKRIRKSVSIAEIAVRILFFTVAWFPQNTRVAFEVASIRPTVNAPRQAVAAAGRTDGAQFRIAGLTIRDYISMAYAVKLNQISGPDWITTDRFDVAATLPEGTKPDQVPQMMQALLEDRFELKTHREKKDFAVYGLRITSGGLKMAEVPHEPGEERPDPQAPQTFTRQGSGRGIFLDLGQGSHSTLPITKLLRESSPWHRWPACWSASSTDQSWTRLV